MSVAIKIPVAIVNVGEVKPTDVIHIQIGIGAQDMGDGMTAWLPTDEELRAYHEEFAKVFPENKVVVTHMGVKITGITDASGE